MSDKLTFGVMDNPPQDTDRAWQIAGDRGAVTFRLGLGGPDILFHSRRPFVGGADSEPEDCEFVDHQCYAHTSSIRGHELFRQWVAAGRDDDNVIRAELERLYESELPAVTW